MRRRPESVDRTRMRQALEAAGCRYVRLNHGTRFSNSRPDLEAIGFDGCLVGIEMKAQDVDPERGLTALQRKELEDIVKAGGRSVSCRLSLENGTWNVQTWHPQKDGTHGTSTWIDLRVFCKDILGGARWPQC